MLVHGDNEVITAVNQPGNISVWGCISRAYQLSHYRNEIYIHGNVYMYPINTVCIQAIALHNAQAYFGY